MRARLLLGAAAVASAFAFAGTGSAVGTCVGATQLAVCVDQGCYDPQCTVPQVTVYGHCTAPVPTAVCLVVSFTVTVP
jgi:hypothetical protein